MKRTNIVIDEILVARVKKVAGVRTTREAVDYALRAVVRAKEAQAIRRFKGSGIWTGDLGRTRRSRV
ncbi:Antitoxin VapB11 [Myxococcaceae bacterium]|jgi:Arc/MetJ family transcription regulator|nr:Antitoxin VapB11 [Myxococcaceae bacterium]